MPSTKLLLVRHGQTDWSRELRHTGRTDVPLNAEGEAQARTLQDRLPTSGVVETWASPLSRALETARLAGLTVDRVDPDLQEWDYGSAEGRTTVSIREQRPRWDVWVDGVQVLGGGGESIDEVADRVDRVIAAARRIDGTVALVAHAHLLRILSARWLGQPPQFGRHIHLDAASWCLLGWQREAPAILHWNVTT
ncbi:MAG: histidine phosphatase family protein [Acidimicrobiales bacterium]|nr:histidine phosphatase family protein [Acidimicrobiales bacterium]